MKHLHFDSVGGASGDMILAALLDLGVDAAAINAGLHIHGLETVTVEVAPHSEHGLHGKQVFVRTGTGQHADHHHGHEHRGLREIRALIAASQLPDAVKQNAGRVFQRLAEAEAAVHHSTPEEVHFHEVGALDSIADILGACLGLHLLGVEAVSVSPLPLGSGTVECAHGTLPVPAPGTLELLRGFPVAACDEPFEMVTPTGAALLTTWCSVPQIPSGSRPQAIGHGFGHRQLQRRPNLLRALLLDAPAAVTATDDTCLVLETNIDDSTPEIVGALVGQLLAAGAWDVFTTPIQMKKQRPGVMLSVLCPPALRDRLLDLIFTESSTFGVREHLTRRTMLERHVREVETAYGAVRVKVGAWQGREVTRAPEYEDCLARATQSQVPVRVVYEAAVAAAQPKT